MTVVALRLAGPLQSWGSGSRFVRRTTEIAPTKSGVLGLIAAAQGIRRTEPLEHLLKLRMGVRIDQPGQLLRDFQTARRPEKARDGSVVWKPLPLSYRYYMSDAIYLVVLEGDRPLLEGIDEALRSPEFPLYLGRRSCPPAGAVALGVHDSDLETALEKAKWLASKRHQETRKREKEVSLDTVRDVSEGEKSEDSYLDTPISFDPNQRQYAWRPVIRGHARVPNPSWVEDARPEHDPMSELDPVLGHDPMSALGGW
jgi:CRISPR system Cascade subunit CasD